MTVAGGVPAVALSLLDKAQDYDLSSLQLITFGGAPPPLSLPGRIRAELAHARAGLGHDRDVGNLHHPFGRGLSRPSVQLRAGFAGMPASGSWTAKRNCRPARRANVGVWPRYVKGYWNRPSATAEVFRDGWLKTGDLAMLDDKGFCTLLDREADMLIRGGKTSIASKWRMFCSSIRRSPMRP